MSLKVAAGIALAGLLTMQGGVAHGSDEFAAVSRGVPDSQAIRIVNTHGTGVIHGPDGSSFYPTGPVPAGTLLVIPEEDGTLPGGLTLVDIAAGRTKNVVATAAVECYGGTYMAVLNTWTGVQTATNCVHIGTVAGTATYWFGVAAGLPAAAIGQGLGYYQGYNGSTFGVWAKWYNLGFASDGGPTSTVVP